MWSKYVSINVWRDFRLPVSSFATVAQKGFYRKFTAKIYFLNRAFYVTTTDADIGSVKSFHASLDEYLDHMLVKFEQNRTVRNYKKMVFFGQKMVNNFD